MSVRDTTLLLHELGLARQREWQLIVACSRGRLDTSNRESIRSLLDGSTAGALQEQVDGRELIATASRHRVDPLLHRHLSAWSGDAVPPAALALLEQAARLRMRQALMLAGEMIELVDLFEREGVSAIPYKGPALASLIYGNFALRPSEDLDFVLRQRDIPQAFEVLRSAGYKAELDPEIARDAQCLERGNIGQYCFYSRSGQLVELHTEKTLRYFPVPLDWEGLHGRIQTVAISGRSVKTFSLEDLLILLSVHGAKHFWNRLCWIADIAEIVRTPRGVDWTLSEKLAARMGCRRMWLLGLSLAKEILEAPLPPAISAQIKSDRTVVALSRRVQMNLPLGNEWAPGAPERLFFRMRSHENALDGVRQCFRMATQPTEQDWRAHEFPEWAWPVYTLLRPWRLLRNHGLGLRR
jgi:hypothetical protein